MPTKSRFQSFLSFTLFIDNPKNAEFESYLDSFLVKYLEEDETGINKLLFQIYKTKFRSI